MPIYILCILVYESIALYTVHGVWFIRQVKLNLTSGKESTRVFMMIKMKWAAAHIGNFLQSPQAKKLLFTQYFNNYMLCRNIFDIFAFFHSLSLSPPFWLSSHGVFAIDFVYVDLDVDANVRILLSYRNEISFLSSNFYLLKLYRWKKTESVFCNTAIE